MISKHNLGWLFSNFMLAIPNCFPKPAAVNAAQSAPARCPACIASTFISVSHADTAQPLDGALRQFLNSIPEMAAGPLFQTSWQGMLDGSGDAELETRKGREPWNGILKGKNNVSARRTRRVVGLTEVLCKVSPGEFHTVSSGRGLNEPQMPNVTPLHRQKKYGMRIWDLQELQRQKWLLPQASSLQTHERGHKWFALLYFKIITEAKCLKDQV